MDRRELLLSALLAGVTTACAFGGDDGGGTRAPTDRRDGRGVEAAKPRAADLAPSAFPLGVASGDPLADRVMLWTRVFPAPGSATAPVEVAFDVATDEEFEHLVASGLAEATADLAHSLHVDVTGLEPDTWYFYRFRAGGQTSATARTRTFPAAGTDVDRFDFVFSTCQDFQWGQYAAWSHVASESDLDAVVFLGDYIYEMNFGDMSPDKSGARVWATPEATTLAHYRARYEQVRGDASLRAAHHRAPWIITFDDHEVSDNYAGDVGGSDIEEPNSRDRRLAAYQAWYEHVPVRLAEPPAGSSPDDFDVLAVHRGFRFGSLASLFVIETRQHADPPACRATTGYLADQGPLCSAADDPDRSNLGEVQEKWLFEQLEHADARWNILANPVMLADMNIGTPEAPQYYRDMWIGYPAARERLLAKFVEAKVPNPVTITGDWHASFVLDVQRDPHGPTPTTVMPEFLVTAISSIVFAQDHRASNPQIRYFEALNGYAKATVTRAAFECTFCHLADVWDPQSPISSRSTWRLADGEKVPVES